MRLRLFYLVLFVFFISSVYAIDLGNLIDQGLASNGSVQQNYFGESEVGDYVATTQQDSIFNETEEELFQQAFKNSQETGQDPNQALEDILKSKGVYGVSAETDSASVNVSRVKHIFKNSTFSNQPGKGKIVSVRKASIFDRFAEFLGKIGKKISSTTGYVIRSGSYYDIDLPSAPYNPEINEFSNKYSLFKTLTGMAIIGLPKWAYDGSKSSDSIFEAKYTKSGLPNPGLGTTVFDLQLGSNMSREGAVNGIVYNTGYYLDENKNKWVPFNFDGTQIGNTSWLREKGSASVVLSNFTKNDYAVFLGYACVKSKDSAWSCNEGKWTAFVLGLGNVSYTQNIGEVPAMGYSDIKDLNLTDIVSILKQFNVSALDFSPPIVDVLLISEKPNVQTTSGTVEKLPFRLVNVGNREINNLSLTLDLGENSIAEVVSANIPSSIPINSSVSGSIEILFKEAVNFNLYLYASKLYDEVDTSDNSFTFNISIAGAEGNSNPVDNGTNYEVRYINYTVKEPYSKQNYTSGSGELSVISGTNKIRTVFGGYFANRSINPTLEVDFRAKLTQEAISSSPYLSSFYVSGKMVTGDRENVPYRITITNTKNGKKYYTDTLESLYSYYFNPKDIIPDFEFCTTYNVKADVVSDNTSETIDVLKIKPFNACPNLNFVVPINVKRLQKLDGEYILITGGKMDERLYENGYIDYTITFTDTEGKKYTTPVLNGSQGYSLLPLYGNGSIFGDKFKNAYFGNDGRVLTTKVEVIRVNSKKSYAQTDTFNTGFTWNGWNATQTVLTNDLLLRDEKIKPFYQSFDFTANGNLVTNPYINESPWDTKVRLSYYTYVANPSYMSHDVYDKILLESGFIFSIYDLTQETEVYHLEYNFKDIISCSGHLANGVDITCLSQIKPLPAFINGDVYESRLSITGKHSDKFIPTPPLRVMYIDAYQFIQNNPLLRTRFAYLYNAPGSMTIKGEEVKNGAKYIPSITLTYLPKNTKVNSTTGQISVLSKEEVNQRLISSDQLGVLEGSYPQGYYHLDYLYDENYPDTSVYLTLDIIPTDISTQTQKNQFNCNIGRYSGFCKRDTGGLQFNYLDSGNGFLYRITLSDVNRVFLKRYRDNSQFYDSIIYDILSEIDRNPIIDFSIPTTFDKIKSYTSGATYYGFGPTILGQGYNDWSGVGRNLFDNYYLYSNAPLINIGNYVDGVSIYADSIYLKDTTNNTLYYINGTNTDLRNGMELSQALSKLNLVEGRKYSVDLRVKQYAGKKIVPSISTSFVYWRNYSQIYQFVSKDLKKIPSLSSTVIGPSLTNSKDYNCMNISRPGCVFYNHTNVWGDSYGYGSGDRAGSTMIMGSANDFVAPRFMTQFGIYWPTYAGPDANTNVMRRYYSSSPLSSASSYTSATFVVNPKGVVPFDENEQISFEEFSKNIDNITGIPLLSSDNNKYYTFSKYKFDDVYKYYNNIPINSNSYDSRVSDSIVCTSRKEYQGPDSVNFGRFNASDFIKKGSHLMLICYWSNMNKLEVYHIAIDQFYPDKTVTYLNNLDSSTANDFKNNYANVVLGKYVEWYPPTPILNVSFLS